MKKGDLMTIMIKTTMWQTETASALGDARQRRCSNANRCSPSCETARSLGSGRA
jgi:hypothetical protein